MSVAIASPRAASPALCTASTLSPAASARPRSTSPAQDAQLPPPRDDSPSPPRNHIRRNDSLRAIEQHAASVRRMQESAAAEAAAQQTARPKPVRLATPSTGYPFPVMVANPQSEEIQPTLEPYRDAPRQKPPSRKGTPEGDGWDTPASSLSRASSIASKRSSAAPSRLAQLPAMTSVFSDASSSASSSSTCSTPSDSVAASSASSTDLESGVTVQAPTTPAEVSHSRIKHAGSTPGAPPPAPLMQLQQPVGQQVMDLQDLRLSSPTSPAMSPRTKQDPDDGVKHPRKAAPAGFSMSSHSQKAPLPGVGSKWEVD